MKKLLLALVVGVPLVACSEEVVVRQHPDPSTPAPGDSTAPPTTDPPATTDTPPATKPPVKSSSTLPEDRCLDGQDMNAADVDIKKCPELPSAPDSVPIGTDGKDEYDLGAWEIGTTSTGDTYKYGSLSAPGTNPRTLKFDTGTAPVNAQNIECWAKGYYRLRAILQNPPAAYVALRKAKFQYRFFQFQTDLRNGPTGYKQISSFQDHLVKWVTVVSKTGACQQPTYNAFRDYAKGELTDRGLPVPPDNN